MAVVSRLRVDICIAPNRVLVQFEDDMERTTGERLLAIIGLTELIRHGVMDENYRIDKTGAIQMEINREGSTL